MMEQLDLPEVFVKSLEIHRFMTELSFHCYLFKLKRCYTNPLRLSYHRTTGPLANLFI